MTDNPATCAFLRCKDDFYQQEPMRGQEKFVLRMPKVYWCGKTLGEFGPDQECASADMCNSARTCFSSVITGNALPLEAE